MSDRGAVRPILASAFAVLVAAACFTASAQAQTHVLIAGGLGGEPRFSQRFRALGADLASALQRKYRIAAPNIAWFGEDSTFADSHYRGRSTRDALEKEIAAMRARAKAGEQIVVIFIGHGAGQEGESRVSLPGPDVTVGDVQRWMAGFTEQRVAVVNLTSGSGDFLPILAAPGRVVITATKTAFERNESRFAEFFVKAYTADVADVDKDGRVSLLEAFRYAARETKRVYDDATKLQTEHAQLDDNGTRQNTAEPTGRDGQGLLARRFFFEAPGAPGAPIAAGGDQGIAALYHERFALEGRVDSLRALKPKLTPALYDAELEIVLVSLARKSREIRKAEGRP